MPTPLNNPSVAPTSVIDTLPDGLDASKMKKAVGTRRGVTNGWQFNNVVYNMPDGWKAGDPVTNQVSAPPVPVVPPVPDAATEQAEIQGAEQQ